MMCCACGRAVSRRGGGDDGDEDDGDAAIAAVATASDAISSGLL
jgi:hypothetical protein